MRFLPRRGSASWPVSSSGRWRPARRVGFETVDWFNGSLFNDDTTLPLERGDIETVLAASDLDWSEIDPSILGTLFERGLDPNKRAQLGAHYTDRDKRPRLEPLIRWYQPDSCRNTLQGFSSRWRGRRRGPPPRPAAPAPRPRSPGACSG